MTRSENKVHRERHDPHWVEWMTGVTSGVLVIALMLWVAYEAVTESRISIAEVSSSRSKVQSA